MSHYIVSLGLIVKNDMTRTITILQKLADEALAGNPVSMFRVGALLPKIKPICDKFNTGQLSVEQFVKEFSSELPFKISESKLKSAWNAMCYFDETTLETMQAISDMQKQGAHFHLYSDTNPWHLELIMDQLAKFKFETSTVATTFELKLSKDKVLEAVLEKVGKASSKEKIYLFVGNPMCIKDERIRKEEIEKLSVLRLLAKKHGVEVKDLEAGFIAKSDINKLVSSEITEPFLLSNALEKKSSSESEKQTSSKPASVEEHKGAGVKN